MDQAEVEMLGKNTLADYISYSVKETPLAAKKLPIKADQQRAVAFKKEEIRVVDWDLPTNKVIGNMPERRENKISNQPTKAPSKSFKHCGIEEEKVMA